MNEIVLNTCKIGQGTDCCRYLVVGSGGFDCMKNTPENKAVIDRAWLNPNHIAQGDNCPGKPKEELK